MQKAFKKMENKESSGLIDCSADQSDHSSIEMNDNELMQVGFG